MDEPLSNLDAKLRTQMRVELKRLHQRLAATILYVTHDQTEAMTMGTRIVVMRDGVVQQVDTPDGIYNRPANKFVATFVGTPAMNLFDGDIAREGDDVLVQTAGQKLRLSKEMARAVGQLDSRQVSLGIRPEDITVGELPEGYLPLNATIQVIEPLGHEHIVYCAAGDVAIVARTVNTWSGTVGDNITLGLNADRLHAFHPDTEEALA